jgi:hypothetical protein
MRDGAFSEAGSAFSFLYKPPRSRQDMDQERAGRSVARVPGMWGRDTMLETTAAVIGGRKRVIARRDGREDFTRDLDRFLSFLPTEWDNRSTVACCSSARGREACRSGQRSFWCCSKTNLVKT